MATFKVELPNLPYEKNALEPVISSETLEVHHGKHHQTYVDKFNAALEADGIEAESVIDMFEIVSKLSPAIRNHGGGYWNHKFYWESLRSSSENNKPEGEIAKKINESFGSYEKFKE